MQLARQLLRFRFYFYALLAIVAVALVVFPGVGDALVRHPNRTLTPGAVDPLVTPATLATTICTPTAAAGVGVTRATRNLLFASYGISRSDRHLYFIDHLIPLALGGTNAVANLWPRLKHSSRVRTTTRAEAVAHAQLCQGQTDLVTARAAYVAALTAALSTNKSADSGGSSAISQPSDAGSTTGPAATNPPTEAGSTTTAPTTATGSTTTTTTTPSTPVTTSPTTTTSPPPRTSPPPAADRFFADSSPWNTPLGANIEFVDDPHLHNGFGWYVAYAEYSVPVIYSKPTDPIVSIKVPATWGWPATNLNLHLPAGSLASGGTDGELTVINGTTAYSFWVFARDDATHAHAQAWAQDDVVHGSGWGTLSPFRAAGIRGGGSSDLGGEIVGHELTAGIDHALALALNFHPDTCPSAGYALPAISGDGACEGLRFAIPSATRKPSGLSVEGSNVFDALQRYGAFSADAAGGASPVILSADPNSVPASDLEPLYDGDLAKIAPLLRVVR